MFVGVAVQPGIATVQREEEIDVEPKDYLFQTIIYISNNPDVKDLFEQAKNKGGFIDCDYNLRSVYRQLLFRNPRLFRSLIFTKPSMTHKYLNHVYNQGIKITNILGEDKVLEIIKSIQIINPKVLDELNNIIMNNPELSNKLATLKEMNKELNPDTAWEDIPIICTILLLILGYEAIKFAFFFKLFIYFKETNHWIIERILAIFYAKSLIIGAVPYVLLYELECWERP